MEPILTSRSEAVRLRPEAAAPGQARRFVRSLVCEGRDVVELLVSELVTNAVQHAHGQIGVSVCVVGDRSRVEVSDMSPTVPGPGTCGRGLRLVGLLADRWGVDRRSQGKAVWFEVSPHVIWCWLPPTGTPRAL